MFDILIDPDLAELAYRSPGACGISDIDRLSRMLDLDPDELRGDPQSFDEESDLIVPWPVTERIARRLATRGASRLSLPSSGERHIAALTAPTFSIMQASAALPTRT